MVRKRKFLILVTLGLGLLISSLGFGIDQIEQTTKPAQAASTKPIRVVSSLNFYGETAKAVAGTHGQVTSVINSAAVEPHEYKPTTKQAKQVAKANVVIQNGLGYDGWMKKLAKSTNNTKALVNVADVIGKDDGANEHIWYQPKTMSKLADTLANSYAKLDPTHKADYQANAAKYKAKLAKLNQVIDDTKQKVDPANNKVDVSEPVFNYALANLGYQVNNPHFAKAVEDSTDPSPKDIQQIQNDMKKHKIAFFVNNSQETNSTVKNLLKTAKQSNIPVLKVTETKPDGKTYLQWMTDQYKALQKIQARQIK